MIAQSFFVTQVFFVGKMTPFVEFSHHVAIITQQNNGYSPCLLLGINT